jgi:hypothetical protein
VSLWSHKYFWGGEVDAGFGIFILIIFTSIFYLFLKIQRCLSLIQCSLREVIKFFLIILCTSARSWKDTEPIVAGYRYCFSNYWRQPLVRPTTWLPLLSFTCDYEAGWGGGRDPAEWFPSFAGCETIRGNSHLVCVWFVLSPW